MKKSELKQIIREEIEEILEEKSTSQMVKDANKFKKELQQLKRDAKTHPNNKSLQASVVAKEEQLRRVANSIRIARSK